MNRTKPQGGFSETPRARREDGPRSRRTPGVRTPAHGTAPDSRAPPEEPAEWVKQARRLIAFLEESIQLQTADPRRVAAAERAVAAWELSGTSEAAISRVAHLVERAHVAMHEGPRPHSDRALEGCAHILYNGLPGAVRSATDFAKVVDLVRRLEREPQAWPAVVKATSELLGWSGAALNVAGRAIRVALATNPPK